AVTVLLQRSRVAHDKPPALALEQRGIGLGEAAGIGHEARLAEMQRTGEITGEAWLTLGDRLRIEQATLDAIGPRALQLFQRMLERRPGAKQLDPAVLAEQRGCPRLRDQ